MGSKTRYLRGLLVILIASTIFLHAEGEGQEEPEALAPLETSDFADLHSAFLDLEGLQFERPTMELDTPEPEEPPSSNGLLRWIANLLSSLGPVIRLIFYAGLAIAAGSILYFILTQFTDIRFDRMRKRKKVVDDDLLVSARPDKGAALSLLDEADALAKQGRFSEAVHLLLFRSIQDIQTKRKERLPDAMTAREIGNLADLPDGPRSALSPIVRLVEFSFFGGRELRQEDWQTARSSYENFAFGTGWT
ncbi:MAG: hypothetical protein AAF950_02865 [Pseudomonadota bacterium]